MKGLVRISFETHLMVTKPNGDTRFFPLTRRATDEEVREALEFARACGPAFGHEADFDIVEVIVLDAVLTS